MLDERLTIQDGHLKGARITISESLAKELMEDYHSQFGQEKKQPRTRKFNRIYSRDTSSSR